MQYHKIEDETFHTLAIVHNLFKHVSVCSSPYKANAIKPAKTAPALKNLAAAPLLNPSPVDDEDGVGVPARLVLPAMRVKLAQVRRVALLLWTTMERLPKKAPGPLAVDRYKSTYLGIWLSAWTVTSLGE